QMIVRKAGGEKTLIQMLYGRNFDDLIIAISCATFDGVEALISVHFVNHTKDDLLIARQTDTYSIDRKAVEEIRCSIQRIDDPIEFAVCGRACGTFFGDKTRSWKYPVEFFHQHPFSLLVNIRNKVVEPV